MEIEHFSHEHLLSLGEKKRKDEVLCKACNIYCVGPTYNCRELCGFALHESCAKLPQELHNPLLHPHPFGLHPQDQFRCYACARDCSGFTFRCDKCDVNLDLNCAFIRPAMEEREEVVGTHFSHPHHQLLLFQNMPADRINCRVCGTYCSDPTYGCFPCRFFLHRSCFERNLPQETQHFYHPCPLTLYTDPDKSSPCRACRQFWPRGAFYYGCSRCDFVMDIDCTLLPTTQSKSDQEQILHFLHGHPLSLSKIKADHKVNCYVCGKGCIDPIYACGRRYCEYVYFHESCLVLPQEIICHPFHPYHPLTLELLQYGWRCNACRNDIRFNNSAYVCQRNNCRFFLHIECSVIMPAIKFEGHDHLLQFRDKIENIPYIGDKCRACNLSCESYAFSCLYCDFNLHLMCGPLPYSINHKYHIDPIVFTSSPVEDEEGRKRDEFYCDACEEEIRDTLLPIYYCKECPFVAEISCIISEVSSYKSNF